MRVLVDTNVLARALAGPRGPASALLERLAPPHELLCSSFILAELGRVLGYERLRRIHGRDDDGIAAYVAAIRAQAIVLEVATGPGEEIVPRDPDDLPILAAALAGRADVLCTLDRHLLDPAVVVFCATQGIRVLSDVELLAELRAGEAGGNDAG